jgi:hypothetical protein
MPYIALSLSPFSSFFFFLFLSLSLLVSVSFFLFRARSVFLSPAVRPWILIIVAKWVWRSFTFHCLSMRTSLQRRGERWNAHSCVQSSYFCRLFVCFQGLFDAALAKGLVPSPWRHVPWFVKLLGRHRVVGCSARNSGLFALMASSGAVQACFCGHDHYNDTVCERSGVSLVYGRVSSYTPPKDWEGSGGPLPFAPGARVIELDPDADPGAATNHIACLSVKAGASNDRSISFSSGRMSHFERSNGVALERIGKKKHLPSLVSAYHPNHGIR